MKKKFGNYSLPKTFWSPFFLCALCLLSLFTHQTASSTTTVAVITITTCSVSFFLRHPGASPASSSYLLGQWLQLVLPLLPSIHRHCCCDCMISLDVQPATTMKQRQQTATTETAATAPLFVAGSIIFHGWSCIFSTSSLVNLAWESSSELWFVKVIIVNHL